MVLLSSPALLAFLLEGNGRGYPETAPHCPGGSKAAHGGGMCAPQRDPILVVGPGVAVPT